jgi:hypothetical protein
MSKVTISIATVSLELPANIVAGALRVSIIDAAGTVTHTQDINGIVAEFVGVADGQYSAVAVRLDSNGLPLGSPVTEPFTVAPAVIATYEAPHSMFITVSPDA